METELKCAARQGQQQSTRCLRRPAEPIHKNLYTTRKSPEILLFPRVKDDSGGKCVGRESGGGGKERKKQENRLAPSYRSATYRRRTAFQRDAPAHPHLALLTVPTPWCWRCGGEGEGGEGRSGAVRECGERETTEGVFSNNNKRHSRRRVDLLFFRCWNARREEQQERGRASEGAGRSFVERGGRERGGGGERKRKGRGAGSDDRTRDLQSQLSNNSGGQVFTLEKISSHLRFISFFDAARHQHDIIHKQANKKDPQSTTESRESR